MTFGASLNECTCRTRSSCACT